MVTFKEWQVVCDALASGRQAILLRKGGIHEGREGFSFAHDSFLLFPTKFHAQLSHVREGRFEPGQEWKEGDEFEITHHAQARFAVTLKDWAQVEALLPYHIYQEQILRDRFDWEGKGMETGSIHVALVRVSKLAEPVRLTYEKRLGGCRSWVDIPEIPTDCLQGSTPVIEEIKFKKIEKEISAIVRL